MLLRPTLPIRIALAAGALLVLPSLAAAACPQSRIELQPAGGGSFSSAAVRDSFSSDANGSGRARYDLVAGTTAVFALAGPFGSFQSHSDAADEYQLTGPPSFAPVAFAALLDVSLEATADTDPGFGAGASAAWAVLREGESNRDSLRVDSGPSRSATAVATLRIPLLHGVGEPFALVSSANAGAYFGRGTASGQLHFDLPPGYAIESCQGYAGSGSVPVKQATWGRLKALYR